MKMNANGRKIMDWKLSANMVLSIYIGISTIVIPKCNLSAFSLLIIPYNIPIIDRRID